MTLRRGASTTSRPPSSSSGKTTRLEECMKTKSIFMANSLKKPKRFSSKGSDMPSLAAKHIFMCKDPPSFGVFFTYPHSIVGKGNHSSNHIQKLKPKVEEVCRDLGENHCSLMPIKHRLILLGLQYSTEHNAGRIYINLQGGAAQMPSHLISDPGAYAHHNPSQYHGQNQFVSPQGPQPQYPGGHQGYQGHQPHAHHQQAGNAQDEEIERVVKRYLPKLLRQLKRSCCTVM